MRAIKNVGSDMAEKTEADAVFWDAEFRDSKNRVVAAPPLAAGAQIADTHCHLDMLKHPELALARAAAQGVSFLVTVVDPTEDPDYTYRELDNWRAQAAELLAAWRQGSDAFASGASAASVVPAEPAVSAVQAGSVEPPRCRIICGCHPHNAGKYNPDVEKILIRLAEDARTAAIGEIGLDYHYDVSPRPRQREVFRRQLELAAELHLPVALHLREAHEDGLAILDELGWPEAGVLLHCYTLDREQLQPWLERGASVAFGGTLTFNNAEALREAAAAAPLERIMTETDAPFMAPTPLRGTICGPEDTVFTAARLAVLRSIAGGAGENCAALFAQIYKNAMSFFDRKR